MKRISTCIALLLGILFAEGHSGSAVAADQAKQRTRRMVASTLACSDVKVFQRAVDLTVQGDKQAAQEYAMRAAGAGICVILREGEEVVIEQTKLLGPTLVRRVGSPDAYWTNGEKIQ